MAQFEELEIDQGSDVSIEVHLVDKAGAVKNLSGYSASAKMKKTYNSDSADTTEFTTTVQASTGVVTLTLTNAQTDALKAGRYVYDVETSYDDSDSNTIVERVLEGFIHVTPSVTR